MKQTTIEALSSAFEQLQDLIEHLYTAAQVALDNDDFSDASLLQSRADRLYEEAEQLDVIISEMGG